jgi:hypothetical protein
MPPVLALLTEATAAGLHNDYLRACGLAVLTLVLAKLLPARLSPKRHAPCRYFPRTVRTIISATSRTISHPMQSDAHQLALKVRSVVALWYQANLAHEPSVLVEQETYSTS